MNPDPQNPGSDDTGPIDTDNRNSEGAIGFGAPLAFLIIGGVIVGGLLGQPSVGLLVGVALGIAVAVIIWRMDHRK